MSDPSLEAQVQNLEARLRESERRQDEIRSHFEGVLAHWEQHILTERKRADAAEAKLADAEFHLDALRDENTTLRADREQAEKALADCMRQHGSPYVLGGDVLPENVAGVQS